MKRIALMVLVWSSFAAGATVLRPSGEAVSYESFVEELGNAHWVVVGEQHYTPSVQLQEAALIQAMPEDAVVGWEFLTASRQDRVAEAFDQFAQGVISGLDFLSRELGSYPGNSSYVPVLEAVRDRHFDLRAVNLSRAEKAPVTQGGLGALDPSLLPPGFELGSSAYRERFAQTMVGHVPPEKIQNYYEAQCLTDDVMAAELLRGEDSKKRLLIVGAFHSEFGDGVVARIRRRGGGRGASVLLFPPGESPSQSDLIHPKYGPVADFVILP